MDDIFYLHGQSEPDGVDFVAPLGDDLSEMSQNMLAERIRNRHAESHKMRQRQMTLLQFGVDHGLNAHAGNGSDWRTCVVAKVRLDYLAHSPEAYIRIEGEHATELLAQLAEAVAVRERRI